MMNKQYAFSKIKLSQSKYKKGYLYISMILNVDQEVESMDFRYFVDNDEMFTPTKIGFRIKKEFFDLFLSKIMNDDFNTICCNIKDRELHIRHVVDSYRESVDIRYFISSNEFEGWSGQGIRFLIDDYRILKQNLQVLISCNLDYLSFDNLFQGKTITKSKDKVKTSSESRSATGSIANKPLNACRNNPKHIASELESIIRDGS